MDSCAINTVAGKQVSDALWRIMADRDIQHGAEEEGIDEISFGEIQQDVTKAYEHVGREMLAKNVIEERMPVSVIKLSLASCACVRRLDYNGALSEAMKTTRGVGTGAVPATVELIWYVIKHIRGMTMLCEEWKEIQVVVSLHVDDLTMAIKGVSKRMVGIVL